MKRQSYIAKAAYRILKSNIGNTRIIVKAVFPDGSEAQNRDGEPDITITVKHWSSFIRLILLGGYGFVTDYVKQRIDIDGDLRFIGYLIDSEPGTAENLAKSEKQNVSRPFLHWVLNRWHMLVHLAWSRKQAQYNAEYHYGLHPEFYFNYLGPTGAYSTGFWYEDTRDLEEAQKTKWETVLKKLRLKPGMRICSTGSGFGYGEMLAAEKYGAIVDCYNTTRSQNVWLREEVKRRGLEGKVNVFDADHRDVRFKPNTYDRIMSIEHIEHAQDMFRKETIHGFSICLKEGGFGVMQWLSYDLRSEVHLFTRKYLYPGVTMPTLRAIISELAESVCEVLDVQCNRRHYYYTLNAWAENLEKNWKKIEAIDPKFYNESFRRKWTMYLASGAYYLVTPNATARLYQLTFSKGNTDTYPMNREFIYDDTASTAAWVKPHPWVLRDKKINKEYESKIPQPEPEKIVVN